MSAITNKWWQVDHKTLGKPWERWEKCDSAKQYAPARTENNRIASIHGLILFNYLPNLLHIRQRQYSFAELTFKNPLFRMILRISVDVHLICTIVRQFPLPWGVLFMIAIMGMTPTKSAPRTKVQNIKHNNPCLIKDKRRTRSSILCANRARDPFTTAGAAHCKLRQSIPDV